MAGKMKQNEESMIEVILSDSHYSCVEEPVANLIHLTYDDIESAMEVINTSLKQGLYVFIKEKGGNA